MVKRNKCELSGINIELWMAVVIKGVIFWIQPFFAGGSRMHMNIGGISAYTQNVIGKTSTREEMERKEYMSKLQEKQFMERKEYHEELQESLLTVF